MKISPLHRLLLAAVLFFGWLGWLAYLARTASTPVVLSRPQFFVADCAVIADLQEANRLPESHIKIQEIAWCRQPFFKAGDEITVGNLSDQVNLDDWTGPGLYIVPLVKKGDDFLVPAIPRSPGFEPLARDARPRIYRLDDQTSRQLRKIHESEIP